MEIEKLGQLIEAGDASAIAELMSEHGLELQDGKIVAIEEKREWVAGQIGFWDQRQQARKIL
jgi:hypothetical protein